MKIYIFCGTFLKFDSWSPGLGFIPIKYKVNKSDKERKIVKKQLSLKHTKFKNKCNLVWVKFHVWHFLFTFRNIIINQSVSQLGSFSIEPILNPVLKMGSILCWVQFHTYRQLLCLILFNDINILK